MTSLGQIRFNHMYVNYGTSFLPGSGKFAIPYLGVHVFKYTVKSSGLDLSGYLVVDEEDTLSFWAVFKYRQLCHHWRRCPGTQLRSDGLVKVGDQGNPSQVSSSHDIWGPPIPYLRISIVHTIYCCFLSFSKACHFAAAQNGSLIITKIALAVLHLHAQV